MLLNLKIKYCEDVNLLPISVDSIKIPVWLLLLFLANKSDFLMEKKKHKRQQTHTHIKQNVICYNLFY